MVIFDEASQIPVWDAIGAMARGEQVIVVGDPKQLPPTLVGRASGEEGDTEDIQDQEYTTSAGREPPGERLTWHYRSRTKA